MRSIRDWPKLTVLLVFATKPVVAHHSTVGFDLSNTEVFNATVTEFEWKNPHVFIQIDRVDDDGEVTAIEVLPDHVLIHVDWLDVERVVYTDGRGHPEDGERTIQGHTTGYWEGDTLVMDMTLFSQDSVGEYGFPSGPRKHIEERLSVGDDGKTLNYEFMLEDPQYLREPVTGAGIWDYRPDLEPSSVDCDLEAAQRNLQSVD